MVHLTLYHSRIIAQMTFAVVKQPVKRDLQTKVIAASVLRDLRVRSVKVVGDLFLQCIIFDH